jgi:hypothetical protein
MKVYLDDKLVYETIQKTAEVKAFDLKPGYYNLKVEVLNAVADKFTKEITGLRVKQEEMILEVKTKVAKSTAAAPGKLTLDFQASGSGMAYLLIVDPGPPPRVIADRNFYIDFGSNSITADLITNTGSRFGRGLYAWKLIYKGTVKSGKFVVI